MVEAIEARLQLYERMGPGSRDAEIVRDAWHWRELLQRNIDGADHTDDSSVEGLAEYEELPGPWGVIPGGYQVMPWTGPVLATPVHKIL